MQEREGLSHGATTKKALQFRVLSGDRIASPTIKETRVGGWLSGCLRAPNKRGESQAGRPTKERRAGNHRRRERGCVNGRSESASGGRFLDCFTQRRGVPGSPFSVRAPAFYCQPEGQPQWQQNRRLHSDTLAARGALGGVGATLDADEDALLWLELLERLVSAVLLRRDE